MHDKIVSKKVYAAYLCTWTCTFGKHLYTTALTMCFSKYVSECECMYVFCLQVLSVTALEDGTVLLSQFIDIWLKAECSL